MEPRIRILLNILCLVAPLNFFNSLIYSVEANQAGSTYASCDWTKWSTEDLEKQMSPAEWVPNKTADEALGEFFKWATEKTKFVQTSVPTKLNVNYGPKPSQKLDIYGTDLPEDSPIIFFIHGGYWQRWSKDVSGVLVPLFYRNGFKTVALGYTLAPSVKIGDIEDEVMSALNVVIDMNPKLKRIILVGHSVGAHLSAELLHSTKLPMEIASRIGGMILLGGIYDLRPVVPTSFNMLLKMDQKEAESLTPLLQPFNNATYLDDLKILVFVGGNESPEFQRQAAAYYEKLAARFDQAHFCKYESDDHFTIIRKLTDESSQSFNSPNCDVTKIFSK